MKAALVVTVCMLCSTVVHAAGPELLDAGQGARRVLRYQLTPGTRQVCVETARVLGSEGNELLAGDRTTIEVRVESVEGGAARVTSRVVGVEVTPEELRKYPKAAAAMKSMVGMRTSALMNARGELRDQRIFTPPGAHPILRIAGRVAPEDGGGDVVFPREPIGVGARWQDRRGPVRSEVQVLAMRGPKVVLRRTHRFGLTENLMQQLDARPLRFATTMDFEVDLRLPSPVHSRLRSFGTHGRPRAAAAVMDTEVRCREG